MKVRRRAKRKRKRGAVGKGGRKNGGKSKSQRVRGIIWVESEYAGPPDLDGMRKRKKTKENTHKSKQGKKWS